MYVVATAGHVDHGKSTLVRALTGMEPDRWDEERRRGLTIDLGFAWTRLPSGRDVAFVDVPGHERFMSNMLAGLGPVGVVCFVVAADEGWMAQTSDHRDAIAALGITRGVVVLTRSDRASGGTDALVARVRDELRETGLRDAPVISVSALSGAGMEELRGALDALLGALPEPEPQARVRLWVDRSFTITGAGTVVTGTLTAGSLAQGDRLELVGHASTIPASVRTLHSRNQAVESAGPTNRVAVNLRTAASADAIRRGDALVSVDSWPLADTIDVRRTTGAPFGKGPGHVVLHIGTAAVPCALRPLGGDHARLTLDRPLPLQLGDRLVLRSAGGSASLAGARILDLDPPSLDRRGDGARRTDTLATMPLGGDVRLEVARRGAVRIEHLRRLGMVDVETVPEGVRAWGEWWVHEPVIDAWKQKLLGAVRDLRERDPLSPGLSRGAAANLLGWVESPLLDMVVREAGLEYRAGTIILPGQDAGLGAAEAGISAVENRLTAEPFAAPEAHDLQALGLGPRELAAAERADRLLRLAPGIVVLPRTPALAMRKLAALPQPFTTSEARQALGTTRRIVIPLLEHLDGRGWTRRLDAGRRIIA